MAADLLPFRGAGPQRADLWLDEPVDRVARVVALDLLATATRQRARLDDPDDAEALHDFRVALRRLRSWLRAYHEVLEPGVGKRLRRRLRDLARATSAGRDGEVHQEWLRKTKGLRRGRRREGTEWLVARIEEQARTASRALKADVAKDFAPLRDKLQSRLERYERFVHDAGPVTTFAAATAALVSDHARLLRERLALVRTTADEEPGHEARIMAKHLRYLLERLAPAVPGARELVARLKELQDTLGDLHDAQVFGDEVTAAMATAAADQSRRVATQVLEGSAGRFPLRKAGRDPLRAGLLATTQALRERVEQSFADFARDWHGDASARFFTQVEEVAATLRARRPAPTGGVRRWRLHRLPPEVEALPATDVEEGTLPGERFVERVRRVKSGKDVRYYRLLRTAEGEIHEETTKDVFDALWGLARKQRDRRRRRTMHDGELAWTVDELLDQKQVVASVHVPVADADVTVPAWMAPHVEREIDEG